MTFEPPHRLTSRSVAPTSESVASSTFQTSSPRPPPCHTSPTLSVVSTWELGRFTLPWHITISSIPQPLRSQLPLSVVTTWVGVVSRIWTTNLDDKCCPAYFEEKSSTLVDSWAVHPHHNRLLPPLLRTRPHMFVHIFIYVLHPIALLVRFLAVQLARGAKLR